MNAGPYAQLLARNCERAAAPPARILSFFKRYDTDGSGQLSYDEMRLMVRDFNCLMEGKDSAALLLDRYSKGKGYLTYMDFITKVLRLPNDSLRSSVGSSRPATSEVVASVASKLRTKVMTLPAGQQKAF